MYRVQMSPYKAITIRNAQLKTEYEFNNVIPQCNLIFNNVIPFNA